MTYQLQRERKITYSLNEREEAEQRSKGSVLFCVVLPLHVQSAGSVAHQHLGYDLQTSAAGCETT